MIFEIPNPCDGYERLQQLLFGVFFCLVVHFPWQRTVGQFTKKKRVIAPVVGKVQHKDKINIFHFRCSHLSTISRITFDSNQKFLKKCFL